MVYVHMYVVTILYFAHAFVSRYFALHIIEMHVQHFISTEMLSYFLKCLYRIRMWNYWQVEYLAICSKNAIGEIFNWWF